MSFKKRATKSIALALVGVTIATPMLNTASAMENQTNNLQKIENTEIINENGEDISLIKAEDNSYQAEFNRDKEILFIRIII